MNHNISSEINIARGKLCISLHLMNGKNHDSVILHLDLTVDRRGVSDIIILPFKTFALNRHLLSSTPCRNRLALNIHAVLSLNRRMIDSNDLPCNYRLNRMHGPVVHRTIRKHLRLTVQIRIKVVVIITVDSVDLSCSLGNQNLGIIRSSLDDTGKPFLVNSICNSLFRQLLH